LEDQKRLLSHLWQSGFINDKKKVLEKKSAAHELQGGLL
jgi:hypothetical protein